MEQGLDYRDSEELSWCPSWTNSQWQEWSCGLVHCPARNATDPIWRVLASSDWISFWTPLKLQHSIPCWKSVQWKPSACRSCQCCPKKGSSKVCGWICSVWPSWVWESQHASTGNSVSWSLGHSSRSSFHCMAFFSSLKRNVITYHSSKVQIAFLASPNRISSWTPLKLQHSNPNPNLLAIQLWCIDFLTPPTPFIIPHRLPAFLESLMPLKNGCSIHARCSKSSLKHSIHFCGLFSEFKTILLHIILPHV